MELKIVNIQEDSRVDNGRSVQVIRVTFNLGQYGPFIDTFVKEGFTAAQVEARAAELRTQLQALVKV